MRISWMTEDLAGGLVLALAAIAGVLAVNIGASAPIYDALLHAHLGGQLGALDLDKSVQHWINDGLMVIFFLVVAMEIKREAMFGALSRWRLAALPVYGALGGMVVPAVIFVGIVGIESAEASGWAIPSATDIAFAIGVLSVFGNRVPPALRTFLLTLAVVDDLGAIIIIAIFYTADLNLGALAGAGLMVAVLAGLNLTGFRRLTPYVIFGALLWICVLKSGVHATLAGVALGFAVPMHPDGRGRVPLAVLEHRLKPWVTFAIMPLFAFANAGVPLGGISWGDVTQPMVLAIALGLFVGKQIGVYGTSVLAIRTGLAEAPLGATGMQLYGVALLAGIGFTMSLFIGTLAFPDTAHHNAVRLGVIIGSLASALVGSMVLVWATGPVRTAARAPGAGAPPGA